MELCTLSASDHNIFHQVWVWEMMTNCKRQCPDAIFCKWNQNLEVKIIMKIWNSAYPRGTFTHLQIDFILLPSNHGYRHFTFTFMHLADAFIQSDLHCIQVTVSTFDQLLLSLGIEPMILALLAPCSASWACKRLQDCKSVCKVVYIIVKTMLLAEVNTVSHCTKAKINYGNMI